MEIAIRPWRNMDAEALASILNNKKVQDNLRDGLPYPYQTEDAEAYIAATLAAPEDSQYSWAITVDDVAVGSIAIFRQDNVHRRTGEIGYYIGEDWWGKGIGTVAVKAASAEVFSHTDILRIYGEPFAFNKGSCRILEKAGFAHEGTLRKDAVKNGVITDTEMYALVKA